MRRTIYVLSLAAIISFLVGLWYELGRSGRSPLKHRSAIDVTVLAPKGVFPAAFIERLKTSEKINIVLTEKPTTKALLNEILRTGTEYQVVVFPSYLSDSLSYSEYFLPLNDVLGSKGLRAATQQISVDFLSLGKDPDNAYTLPLLWGVNGWLLPQGMEVDRINLEDLVTKLDSNSMLNLLPDPIEFFGVMTKVRPALRTWIGTGNREEFQKDVAPLQSRIKVIDTGSKSSGLQQISSGQLDKVSRDRFRLADEKSHLWVQYLALKRGSQPPDKILEVIETLYSMTWTKDLSETAQMAHCSRSINGVKGVIENLKPSYIRQLPISRIELISAHEAYEPLFLNYLRGQYQSASFQ